MHRNRSILALALTILVGACAPVTTYTDAEAPKRLKLDSATTQVNLHFAPGSAALSAGEAARLRQLAATGRIDPSDRVSVAVNGSTQLAQARAGAVAATLLNYGIVPVTDYGDAPPNGAVVAITRTLVTLPPCPNWSKPSYSDFGNQPSSNFGCANETNLGMMVAHPTDLASGLPVSGAPGQPAAAAVNRYMNDKVQLPTSNTALPIATQSSGGQGPGTNPNSPGGSQ
jgi:pilus assembly protein CpaD